jgi:hypothetical protein
MRVPLVQPNDSTCCSLRKFARSHLSRVLLEPLLKCRPPPSFSYFTRLLQAFSDDFDEQTRVLYFMSGSYWENVENDAVRDFARRSCRES